VECKKFAQTGVDRQLYSCDAQRHVRAARALGTGSEVVAAWAEHRQNGSNCEDKFMTIIDTAEVYCCDFLCVLYPCYEKHVQGGCRHQSWFVWVGARPFLGV
jgi:hypothetical protein